MKLTIQLVPSTAWYTNVRSNVSKEEWDIIRKKSYNLAGGVCMICGDKGKNQGFKWDLECHEEWKYNPNELTQTLVALNALCPLCHKVKHPGLAEMKGESELVIKQLMKVNSMSRNEALQELEFAFITWRTRSQYNWDLDISYIQEFLKL